MFLLNPHDQSHPRFHFLAEVANGNLTTDLWLGGEFSYDDENQLIGQDGGGRITTLIYDGLGRLRTVIEYDSYYDNEELYYYEVGHTRHIYDGRLAIQQRSYTDVPEIAFTRGNDLSGSIEGAGGIGGLLGFSRGYSGGSFTNHNFYHSDGNGNVTYLVTASQTMGASYRYDPFGSTISASGSVSGENPYRFSSKLYHPTLDLYYYGYRWYSPQLQRWLNRDPIKEYGGLNLYGFVGNNPLTWVDSFGLSGGTPTPPSGIPGGPWKWNPDPGNSRGGCYGPQNPEKGPKPNLTWDPKNDYWKLNDGKGNAQRYDPKGNPVGVNDLKKGHCPRPKPPCPPPSKCSPLSNGAKAGAIGAAVTIGFGIGYGASQLPVCGGGNVSDFYGDVLYDTFYR